MASAGMARFLVAAVAAAPCRRVTYGCTLTTLASSSPPLNNYEADVRLNGIPDSDGDDDDDTPNGGDTVPHGYKVEFDVNRRCWKASAHSEAATKT